MIINKKIKLAIIGLGYVGLPLAIEFSKKREVVGFDISAKRIEELKSNHDRTKEVKKIELKRAKKNLNLTSSQNFLNKANCFIIAIPTPVTKKKIPNLKPLIQASKVVGKNLKKGSIVIYESTVFPGCTEEVCVPLLEKSSGLKFNKDFFCGYSPERINPGDKLYKLKDIIKITSGSTNKISKIIDNLYKEIIIAGTHKVKNIKVAEAAKVIENTQRDLNVAFVNELCMLFNRMDIDTHSVLEAAGTKWNFLPFKPGLVGGHCIGVDPYYLTYKAKKLKFNPQIILAGREINDKMSQYIVTQFKNEMIRKSIKINKAKVLVMGLTFKENCPDIRNSGSKLVVGGLKKLGCDVDLYDPLADKLDIKKEYNDFSKNILIKNTYDGIILAVAHNQFKKMKFDSIRRLCKKKYVIYDIKNIFNSKNTGLKL